MTVPDMTVAEYLKTKALASCVTCGGTGSYFKQVALRSEPWNPHKAVAESTPLKVVELVCLCARWK